MQNIVNKQFIPLILKKTIPKCKKINPSTLGWVRPDGVINFQTSEAASNYAKNRVILALKLPKPFERGVLLKENQVIAEVNGDSKTIDLKCFSDKLKGTTFVHGHPSINGREALPISLQDFITMISQDIYKVVAYNSKGEFSQLTKNADKSLLYKLLPKKMQKVLDLLYNIGLGSSATEEYSKKYSRLFPKEIQNRVSQGIHKNVGIPYGNANIIKKYDKNPYTKDEIINISIINTEKLNDGSLRKMIHEFWQKMSKKLNVKYETNYSNL